MCANDGTTFSLDSRGYHQGSVNFKRSPARFLFCLRPLFKRAPFFFASSNSSSASRPKRRASRRICHLNSHGSIPTRGAGENLAVFPMASSSASCCLSGSPDLQSHSFHLRCSFHKHGGCGVTGSYQFVQSGTVTPIVCPGGHDQYLLPALSCAEYLQFQQNSECFQR